jgi:hypothetical protein
MCPAEDFFSCFKMPAPPNENIIAGIRGQFFSAIERCLLSSTERPPAFGITLIPGDQKVKLFSTDGRTMTYEQLELTTRVRLRERLILPTAFCKQMLRLAKTAQTTRLAFGKDHALFAADDTLLFTPTLRNLVNPLPFESVLQRHMPNRLKAKFVAIPKPKLGLMLQRALSCRIRGRDRSNPWRRDAFTKVKVHNNVIEFFSQSDRGVVLDETDVPDHPNVEEVKVRPDLLLKAYAWADKMLVTKKSVLLATDDMHTLCVIAVSKMVPKDAGELPSGALGEALAGLAGLSPGKRSFSDSRKASRHRRKNATCEVR